MADSASTPSPATGATTSAGTREPATGRTESLDRSEVRDSADNSPRVPAKEIKGKKVRAIPYQGGTQIEVTKENFASVGIDHPAVLWDFRDVNGAWTVEVYEGEEGNQPTNTLSIEAAKFLTEKHSHAFEFING